MDKIPSSSLSKKRILISTALFLCVPILYYVLTNRIEDETLAMTFALNFGGWALIIYDWNLFALHYNRAKKNKKDTLLFTLIGIVFLGVWAWVNKAFIHPHMILPNTETAMEYRFAKPAILIAYSFMQASIINITFKCLTDHLDITSRELLIILFTGFSFGLLYTLLLTPPNGILIAKTFLYNFVLVSFNSYLYNQTSSFLPGILATGIVYFVMICFLIF